MGAVGWLPEEWTHDDWFLCAIVDVFGLACRHSWYRRVRTRRIGCPESCCQHLLAWRRGMQPRQASALVLALFTPYYLGNSSTLLRAMPAPARDWSGCTGFWTIAPCRPHGVYPSAGIVDRTSSSLWLSCQTIADRKLFLVPMSPEISIHVARPTLAGYTDRVDLFAWQALGHSKLDKPFREAL